MVDRRHDPLLNCLTFYKQNGSLMGQRAGSSVIQRYKGDIYKTSICIIQTATNKKKTR